MTGPLRATDVAPFVITCVPGDLPPAPPDVTALEQFYEQFYELVGHPKRRHGATTPD